MCISGKRVRNTLATYPKVQNNSSKGELILDVVTDREICKERRALLDALGGAYGPSGSW